MFSGIIEDTGIVKEIKQNGGNRSFYIHSRLAPELKVDQSLAHNGVCLTVEEVQPGENLYRVTAIEETLHKSMLGSLEKGSRVNLERSVGVNNRFDGHFVQGHVDATGVVEKIRELDGSWEFTISYNPEFENLIVPQGSITLMGISLTIAHSYPEKNQLAVAIIPYTYENTNISDWKEGGKINLEFDVLGKYVSKILGKMQPK